MATGTVTVSNIPAGTTKTFSSSPPSSDYYLVGLYDEDDILITSASTTDISISSDRTITALYNKKCTNCKVYTIESIDAGYTAFFNIESVNDDTYSNNIMVTDQSDFPIVFTKCDDENIILTVIDPNEQTVSKPILYVNYFLSSCLTCDEITRDPEYGCLPTSSVGTGSQDSDCSNGIDVLFVIDRTSSMTSVLESLKTNIDAVVGDIKKKVGTDIYRLGLVTVWESVFNNPKVDIVCKFDNNNINSFRRKLKRISTRGGGATLEEPMGNGLVTAINNSGLQYRSSISKLLITITDNPALDPDLVENAINFCYSNDIHMYSIILGGTSTINAWQSYYNNSSFGISSGNKYVYQSTFGGNIYTSISDILINYFCK